MEKVKECTNCKKSIEEFDPYPLPNGSVGKKFLYVAWIPDGPDGALDDYTDDYDREGMCIYCSHECFCKHRGLTPPAEPSVDGCSSLDDWDCRMCGESFWDVGGCWQAQFNVYLNADDEEEAGIASNCVFTCSLQCVADAYGYMMRCQYREYDPELSVCFCTNRECEAWGATNCPWWDPCHGDPHGCPSCEFDVHPTALV